MRSVHMESKRSVSRLAASIAVAAAAAIPLLVVEPTGTSIRHQFVLIAGSGSGSGSDISISVMDGRLYDLIPEPKWALNCLRETNRNGIRVEDSIRIAPHDRGFLDVPASREALAPFLAEALDIPPADSGELTARWLKPRRTPLHMETPGPRDGQLGLAFLVRAICSATLGIAVAATLVAAIPAIRSFHRLKSGPRLIREGRCPECGHYTRDTSPCTECGIDWKLEWI